MLSTKAVSTLLTMEWLQIFKEWITYPVIAVRSLMHICVDICLTVKSGAARYGHRTNTVPQPCSHAVRQQGACAGQGSCHIAVA